jgi:hypothetical protein
MPFIDNAQTLLQWSDKNARSQAGITNNTVIEVFTDLHATLTELHKHNIVIGDFNDMNILIKGKHAYLIDTDSWQFGTFRCAMYTDKYVDPLLCNTQKQGSIEMMTLQKPHTPASDWYAFSVLLWKTLLFVDPYGGMYKPKDKTKAIKQYLRPLHRITAMHPDVIYPKHAYPYKSLAKDVLAWMENLLHKDVRTPLPFYLLQQMKWTICPSCGVEYSSAMCPTCQHSSYHVLPQVSVHGNVRLQEIYRTTGTIIYTTFQQGKLQYIVYDQGNYMREDGTVFHKGVLSLSTACSIQGTTTYLMDRSYVTSHKPYTPSLTQLVDTVGTRTVFDSNAQEKCYSEQGIIIKETQTLYGTKKQNIAQGIEGKTLVWMGTTGGFAFYTTGAISQGYIIPDGDGLALPCTLPAIVGTLIDIQCVQSQQRIWLLFHTKRGSSYYNTCIALDTKGTLIGHHETLADDGLWLSTIYGKTAAGEHLFCPSDQGIIRINCDHDQWTEKVFTDTEPYIHSSCQLLTSAQGIYVITAKTIKLLTLS